MSLTHFFRRWKSASFLSITPSLVQVPISSAAIAADPSLANDKSYDLQVTVDSGERWLSTDVVVSLSKGSFYESSSADQQYAQSNLWSVFPQLQFDTFLSSSNFGKPVILGSYQPTSSKPVFTSTQVNASWGAFSDSGTGTFTVGRFTVSSDAVGTVVGETASTKTLGGPQKQFSFNLGNVPLPSISGTVYNDTNSNGNLDSGESGIAGVKVYLDKNNNGKYDSGEKYQYTDSNGNYSFDPLTAGTYYVREITPSGDRVTQPSGSKYTCMISSGEDGVDKNFGNVSSLSSISGEIYSDTNGNGKLDSSESGISNVKVYLDKNNNGKYDHGEKYQYTDSKGDYEFESLTAGTYYVREALPPGYRRTQPSSSKYTCMLSAGVDGMNKNFGNDPRVNISGTVFGDNNSNGKKDSGDGGASGWTIYIDSNNDGKLDSGDISTKSSSTGAFAFNNLVAGTFHIRIQSVSHYKITTASSITLTLAGGTVKSGLLFGIKKV